MEQACQDFLAPSNQIALQIDQIGISYTQLLKEVSSFAKENQKASVLFQSYDPFNPKETIVALLTAYRLRIPIYIHAPDLPPWQKQYYTEQISLFLEKNLNHKVWIFLNTSGSTNLPKIACYSFDNIYFSALGSIEYFNLNSSSITQINLPLYHISAFMALMRSLFSYGKCLFLPKAPKEFIASETTHISFVPVQLKRFLETPSSVPSLQVLLLGGQRIEDALVEQAKHLPIISCYGMSETSSHILCGKANKLTDVLPYRSMQLAEDGEILVKGPIVFLGYLSEGMIQSPLNQAGFFATKDFAQKQKDGFWTILKRKDALFISKGVNIQKEEVETALCKLPYILEARVFSIQEPHYGDKLCAYLVATEERPLNELLQDLSLFLAKAKQPKQIYYVKALPISMKQSI